VHVPSERPPAPEPAQAPSLPPPEAASVLSPEWQCGFLAATEWSFVSGNYTSSGAAIGWTRLRYPLIAGEAATPAQRLIAAADSANGISSPLDIRSWLFIPPELTVHCLRPPLGEWICLDAITHLQAEGVGLATSTLYDERGLIGRSTQALLISQR
jgi:hypothetical protein